MSFCKLCDAERQGREPRKKNQINLTDTQMAYLAGLVDGEGHIGMSMAKRKSGKHKGSHFVYVRMTIAVTHLGLYDIQSSYGFGKIYSHKPTNRRHKTRYDWCIRSNEMKQVLPKILPFLKIRNQQAELLLRYFGLPRTKDETYRNSVHTIYQQLKLLNKRGLEDDGS